MSPDPAAPALLAAIASRAGAADHREGDVAADVAALHQAGWLAACLPHAAGGAGWGTEPGGTLAALDALRGLGRSNLSVARLFEGHMNAVKLVALYAAEELREKSFAAVRDGVLFGVWGADDPARPLALRDEGDALILEGAKRFASGLGIVRHAVVTAGDRLLLVPTDDDTRADPAGWTMAGMRATRSGRYDFTGLALPPNALLGEASDYYREPFFEGGVWRYCAAHLGGAEALHDAVCETLVGLGRTGDPHQQDRIAVSAMALETARLWLLRAASEVEAEGADPRKAALSLFAREVTERSCREVIAAAERALGMAAHVEGSVIERMRRDLALFLCQAAPDAKRARAVGTLLDTGTRIEEL
ncbi:acyl-CoA dehydrogenase family protein [Qipengyuania sp.]|uniref:acyl-CoA dehydrogenase family protein n=1 Tax=Qipengyuania sp. TaxID=2004515 RepID=UPI003735C0D3